MIVPAIRSHSYLCGLGPNFIRDPWRYLVSSKYPSIRLRSSRCWFHDSQDCFMDEVCDGYVTSSGTLNTVRRAIPDCDWTPALSQHHQHPCFNKCRSIFEQDWILLMMCKIVPEEAYANADKKSELEANRLNIYLYEQIKDARGLSGLLPIVQCTIKCKLGNNLSAVSDDWVCTALCSTIFSTPVKTPIHTIGTTVRCTELSGKCAASLMRQWTPIPPCLQAITMRPSRIYNIKYHLKHNIHLTTSGDFETSALKFEVDETAADRVLFSIDYPHETDERGCSWYDGEAEVIKHAVGDVS
nr:salicylate decarboxylase [Quercus suber]